MFLFAVLYSADFFVFVFLVLYLFSNFITVLGLFKFYPLSVTESPSCIKRLCNLPLSIPWPCEGIWSCWGLHLVFPSALFDSPNNVCKQTSFEGDLCEDDPCCQCNQCSVWALFWCYQGSAEPSSRMVLRTTRWSKSSSYTFDVDDGGCFGCCCSPCAFFFSSTIFWALDLLTPVRAAVLFIHDSVTDSFQNSFSQWRTCTRFPK